MSVDRKSLSLALLVALLVLAAGCSGINTGGSISPATFLIPGLGRVTPAPLSPTDVHCSPQTVQTLVQAD